MEKKTEQALEIIAKNFLTQPIKDVGIEVKRPEKWKARRLGKGEEK